MHSTAELKTEPQGNLIHVEQNSSKIYKLDVYIYIYIGLYVYIYINMAVTRNRGLSRSHPPSVTYLCRGASVTNPCSRASV